MFCDNCGANLPDNSKFCTGCGTTFNTGGGSVSAYSAPAAPTYTTPTYAAPAPAAPAQPYYNQAAGYGHLPANREPLTVGNYIAMFFLSAIPIVGFILLLMWAFGSNANLNKKNYARAILIIALIAVGIQVLLLIFGVSLFGSLFS